MKSSLKKTGQMGFTLIEIMVVVVILGILAGTIVPKLMDSPEKARTVKAKQDIRVIESSLQMYKLDNYVYPTTDEGLDSLVTGASSSGLSDANATSYLPRVPQDPWGQPYQYLSPGTNGDIDIFSLGPDKTPSDDDIGNWMVE
ncbi:MAG: type II secretion system major pseudopilin GspG [Gammaproteobacteria bacterium]